MKFASFIFVVGIGLFLCLFVAPSSNAATQSDEKSTCFVDMDGDGINDNARDMDEDGIPDLMAKAEQSMSNAPAVEYAASFGDFSTSTASATDLDVEESHSNSFSSRKFSARGLSSDRGGIESGDGFGPGSGIGIGAIKTPVCVGGVCTW